MRSTPTPLTLLKTDLLSQSTSSHSVRGMSVTEMIKNLVFGGWSGTPPPRIEDVAQTANKLQFLEKDIPLPQELQLDNTQPIFDVLCEDAVMFYTVRHNYRRA